MAKPKAQTETAQPLATAILSVEMWPIERVRPYEKNARKIPESAVQKCAASIKQFGWRQPIVVDAQGVIVVGHVRLLAAQYLKLTVVPVHVASDLTPAQIKAYRLADNRTHEETGWDFDVLGPELIDIKGLDMSFNLSVTGFEMKDIAQTVLADFKPSGKGKKGDSSGEEGLKFRVIVDCESEMQQAQLLERFEKEGLTCRPLIS
jgi:hypothetical protein